MSVRSIREIVSGRQQVDGAGVKLHRVISQLNVEAFDPFLLLDAFDTTNPEDYIKGFPWHPHRGIETVTYLIRGEIEHGDSLGNKGRILDGDCQWMTAGSGIMHQEMPQPSAGSPTEEKETITGELAERMLGVQLWINLPRKDKMAPPQYRDITSSKIPRIQREGCVVGVISGHYETADGAVQGDYVRTTLLDVEMEPGARWVLETQQDANLFVYIIEGSGQFGDTDQQPVSSKKAVLFHPGDEFVARAGQEGMRFLLFSALSLQEPIAWGGSMVMNTDEEIQKAYRELRQGTFIK